MLTKRQELLIKIRTQHCEGKTSVLAKAIGKDYSYVHRLFLPTEKPGHKGIGLEIMDACNKAFDLPPGYWDGSDNEAASFSTPDMQDRRNLPTQSPYARLLANTFDALGMDPVTAKKAFVAATQVLIDHSNGGIGLTTLRPAPAGAPSSTLIPDPEQPVQHS